MTRPAAFQASYSDFKLVKTRKVAQFIFEVPIEGVDAALAVVGGMPDPGAERWFGIAPLKEEAAKAPKAKAEWRDLTPATQAVLRCKEPAFWKFLEERLNDNDPIEDDKVCAIALREICGVGSRADLSTNHKARVIWHGLDSEYVAWKAI